MVAETVAGFVRAVGPARVLFGSDAAVGANLRPRRGLGRASVACP